MGKLWIYNNTSIQNIQNSGKFVFCPGIIMTLKLGYNFFFTRLYFLLSSRSHPGRSGITIKRGFLHTAEHFSKIITFVFNQKKTWDGF